MFTTMNAKTWNVMKLNRCAAIETQSHNRLYALSVYGTLYSDTYTNRIVKPYQSWILNIDYYCCECCIILCSELGSRLESCIHTDSHTRTHGCQRILNTKTELTFEPTHIWTQRSMNPDDADKIYWNRSTNAFFYARRDRNEGCL